MKDYTTFTRLILFTCEAYLSKAVAEGITSETMHKKIVSGIRSFMTFGRFSKEEQQLLQELGKDPIVERIKAVEISYVVYSLELLKLWVQNVPREVRKNIYLGVSNKKLLMGRASFATMMLHMKRDNEEVYREKREIIDASVLNAKHFYAFFEEKLVKEAA